MKKFLGLVILIMAYVGLSYYSGVVGEQYINEQVELNREKSAAAGVTIDISNYQRGIFQSNFTAKTKIATAQFGPETTSLNAESKVFHGPVIFADGIKFGWFYARTENSLVTSDPEINDLLARVLPQGVGRMTMLGEYGGGYDATWRTDIFTYSDDGGEVLVDGLDIHAEGNFDSLDSSGSFSTGNITATTSDDVAISSTPLYGDLTVESIAPQIALTSLLAKIDSINIDSGDGQAVEFKNLEMAQQQKLVNNKINTKMRLAAESVTGALPMSDLYYEIEFNQVSQEAMLAWAELSPKLHSEGGFSAHQQDLNDALNLLLNKDLNFVLAFGGNAMDGYANAKLDINYAPPADGRSLESVSGAQEYAKLIKGTGQVVVSQEIMDGTPLKMFATPYIGVYIEQKGDEYVVNARINDGKLWVGDMPIDLAPFFEQFVAGFMAAAQ